MHVDMAIKVQRCGCMLPACMLCMPACLFQAEMDVAACSEDVQDVQDVQGVHDV
jgi:hypothetical protein